MFSVPMSPPNVVLTWFFYIHTGYISFVDVNIRSPRLIEVPKLVKLERRNAGMVDLGLHV